MRQTHAGDNDRRAQIGASGDSYAPWSAGAGSLEFHDYRVPPCHAPDSVQSAPPPTITQQPRHKHLINYEMHYGGQNDGRERERETEKKEKKNTFQEGKETNSLGRKEDLARTDVSDGSPGSWSLSAPLLR